MIRQCAWCCRVLGHAVPLEDLSVTHSVCPDCYAKCMGSSCEDRGCPSPTASEDSPATAILSADAIR